MRGVLFLWIFLILLLIGALIWVNMDEEEEPERPARQIRQFIPRSNPLPTADGATPPSRTESETESSATLYGRIDL